MRRFGLPILQPQADDRSEVTKVMRHQNQIVRPRRRRDHEIHERDMLAATEQICTDGAVGLGAKVVEREALVRLAERRDHPRAVTRTREEFGLGYRGKAGTRRL
jgi:hypothetical protein